MTATIRGWKPENYPRKGTDEMVRGMTLALTYKSSEFVGEGVKTQFIGETSPFYNDIKKHVVNDAYALTGAVIFMDIVTSKRGSYTFEEITDVKITLPSDKTDKKAG